MQASLMSRTWNRRSADIFFLVCVFLFWFFFEYSRNQMKYRGFANHAGQPPTLSEEVEVGYY